MLRTHHRPSASSRLTACGSGWKTQHWALNILSNSGQLTHTVTVTLTSECANGDTACPIENQ